MNRNLILRIVIYLQLSVTIFIFCMVHVDPSSLGTHQREFIFGLIPGASAIFIMVFYYLFNEYQYSWKQILITSVIWIANLIATGMCIGLFRV